MFELLFIFQDVFAQAAVTNTTATTVPAATIIQQVPVPAASGSVDLATLLGVLTPIIAGVAGMFVKQQKDMKKNDQNVEQKSTGIIEQFILPLLKQNSTAVNQTAKQDVKLNEVANLLYKVMGEQKANEITGLPEIQQVNLLKDQIRSEIMAEQYQQQLKT